MTASTYLKDVLKWYQKYAEQVTNSTTSYTITEGDGYSYPDNTSDEEKVKIDAQSRSICRLENYAFVLLPILMLLALLRRN